MLCFSRSNTASIGNLAWEYSESCLSSHFLNYQLNSGGSFFQAGMYLPIKMSLLSLVSVVCSIKPFKPGTPITLCTGSAVYVYAVLTPPFDLGSLNPPADISFHIDDVLVDRFSSPSPPAYVYNALVYANSSLSHDLHTISIINGEQNLVRSLFMLDKIVYRYLPHYDLSLPSSWFSYHSFQHHLRWSPKYRVHVVISSKFSGIWNIHFSPDSIFESASFSRPFPLARDHCWDNLGFHRRSYNDFIRGHLLPRLPPNKARGPFTPRSWYFFNTLQSWLASSQWF